VVLLLLLTAGTVFFMGEYLSNSDDWIMFSGSPHVYSGNKVSVGMITDSTGGLLADLRDGRTYCENEMVRKSVLHWVGDRKGNVSAPFVEHYAKELIGYSAVNGIYTYGDTYGTLNLTLSAKVQAAVLKAMGDRVGTVAVYNYKTGEILCAVTTPTFDPDDVPDIDGDTTGAYTGVYMNRFTQSKYIPGSIFKIVTLAAALETIPGIQDQRFTCTGTYIIQNGDITCERAHGTLTLKDAFSNSCNCAFAQIAEQMGSEKLDRYVHLFGITEPVSFDGLTTTTGNFEVIGATAEQIAWSAIGQHKDQVNPCAFLRFVGAVAGGGVGVEPYVVSSVSVGGRETYAASTRKTERLISKSTAEILREYMANNVETKYGADSFVVTSVCAKSGTGEVGGGKTPNAMFTGFLSDPQYPFAFIAAIEEGGYGSKTCIPILNEALKACVEAYGK
jgi:peptidoglycan glycosyltransferase